MTLLLVNPNINELLHGEKYLIINAPAVDIRLPWSAWHHPYGPLLIGSELKLRGFDVRFIDALQSSSEGKISKTKIDTYFIDGNKIDNWQFGITPGKIVNIIQNWSKEGWLPDVIFISCAISHWWPATSDLIIKIKKKFNLPIYLGGGYPTAYPDHAMIHTEADIVVSGSISGISKDSTDFEIYKPFRHPLATAIRFFTINAVGENIVRNKELIVNEIVEKVKLGVSKFILFDEWLLLDQYQDILEILQSIKSADTKITIGRVKPSFIAPGNISPRLIDSDLAILLKETNFQLISIHDDLVHSPFEKNYLSSFEDYKIAMKAFISTGFKPRTDRVDAAVLIGIPGEDITSLTQRIAELASIVGSIHLVPYQYTPNSPEGENYSNWLFGHNGHLDLSKLNGKLFPLTRLAGSAIEDYWELTRLVSLLNSKYRSLTLDFSGKSFVVNMVRNSLKERLWDPFTRKNLVQEVNNDLER